MYKKYVTSFVKLSNEHTVSKISVTIKTVNGSISKIHQKYDWTKHIILKSDLVDEYIYQRIYATTKRATIIAQNIENNGNGRGLMKLRFLAQ